MPADDQHVYHHNIESGPRIYVKVEKNTKGFNYEATVSNAISVDEAMTMLKDAQAKLEAEFGSPVV